MSEGGAPITLADPNAIDPERVADVFAEAADLPPVEARAYLERACRGDARLHAEVESLLDFSHDAQAAPTEDPASVGRFKIHGKVGEGGMGVVFRAHDPVLDREVAVKLVRSTSRDPASRARLLREARAMARVAHPNVVAIHDVGAYADGVFIAMELVPGETLTSWLAREKQPPLEIIEKMAQAGRGLAAAHRAGVLHRDFKLDNVLVGTDGRARVADFGIARASPEGALAPAPTEASPLPESITQLGAIMGTPEFMSPEQFSGRVTEASDQWSFAVALYRALFRQAPFEGVGLIGLRDAVTQKDPAVPRSGDVPPRVTAAILRALRRPPEDRWPSVGALVDVLDAELRVDRLRDPLVFRRQRRLGAVALAVLGLFNVLALGAKTGFRFDIGLKGMLVQALAGTAVLLALAFFLRRALYASPYNRNVMALFLLALSASCAHRALSLAVHPPLSHVLRVDAVMMMALTLFGALVLERWLVWSSGLFALYVATAYAFPALTVPGYGMALILSAALGVWFWREDAASAQPHQTHGIRSK